MGDPVKVHIDTTNEVGAQVDVNIQEASLSPEQQRIQELESRLLELTQTLRTQQQGSRISLRLKEPDTFSGRGKENVDRWLFQVEQYLRAAGESRDPYKVAYTASLLRGQALAWWERWVREEAKNGVDESFCPWSVFVEG